MTRQAANRQGWAGWLAEVVADPARTTNLIRLIRWVVLALVLITAILATAIVVVTVGAPAAATAWIGGTSTVAAAGLAVRAHRRRPTHPRPQAVGRFAATHRAFRPERAVHVEFPLKKRQSR